MEGFETDFSQPFISSYRETALGLIRFQVASIGGLRDGRYGKYFIVKANGADNPISFPGRYWPPRFNVGDIIDAPVVINRYDPENNWVNICNYRDAPQLLQVVTSAGGSVANGPHENVEISTEYVSKLRDGYRSGYSTYDGPYDPHYMAFNADSSIGSGMNIRIDKPAVDNCFESLGEEITQQDLQFANIMTNGIKEGPKFTVKEITALSKKQFEQTLEMRAFDLNFVDKGATFDIREDTGNTTTSFVGFIGEENFPFECTTMVNKIKQMYPEEFGHKVTISGSFIRFDSKRKKEGVWKTESNYRMDNIIAVKGLNLPTVADDMKRVTDAFYREQKYASAVKALRQMKGYMTYNRASKAFTDLGLQFTEEEYYREIESKLVAENKDYDRGYLDILLGIKDETNMQHGEATPKQVNLLVCSPTRN